MTKEIIKKVSNKLVSKSHGLLLRAQDNIALPVARFKNTRKWSKEPLISIVIPTYNRSKILTERTIPAILNQNYNRFELLIVGDRVIDDTKEKVEKIKDSRIRFYDLPVRGIYPLDPRQRWFVQGSVPRNKSHELLVGEGIACLSDDDVVYPNYLEDLVSCAQESGAEFISAAYDAIVNGEKIRRGKEAAVESVGFLCGGMQTWLYRSYLKCFQWNTQSWRKSWNRPCDYDLIIRMKSAGVTFAYTDKTVALVPAVEGTQSSGISVAS